MIKYIRFLVLLILVAATGCNDAASDPKEDKAVGGAEKKGGTPGDFYKRMTGTIGGRLVILHLSKFGPQVAGYYLYTEDSRPVRVSNWQDTVADDHYYLTAEGSQAIDADSGSWDIVISSNTATGKWTGTGGKTADINLKEEYPAGSVQLEAFHYTDTGRMFRSMPYPQATIVFGGLYPSMADKSETAAFLRSAIANAMNLEGGEGMPKGFEIRAWRYFGNYRLDLKGLIDSTAAEEKRKEISYQYNTAFQHSVLYNDNNWLVLEQATAAYTGGAHGTYNTHYLNIDVTARRAWRLTEMVSDTASLKPLLEVAVRDHFKIAVTEKLDSRLLVADMPVAGDVYVTPAGLTFVYQPYEIASYADGMVQLFIPYSQLMPLLTPEFINRQQLGGKDGVAML